MITKSKPIRSKKIRESARGEDCIRCGRKGETRACHYNGIRQHQYGKGRGIKCHDLATAEFCHSCDLMYTEGNMDGFKDVDDRSERFQHWVLMTLFRKYQKGIIKIL